MWQLKVRDACGELLTEADKALKRAREQETAEARLRIMEDGRDKLGNLAKLCKMRLRNGLKTNSPN
jgi:hypothetical protein